MAVTSNFSPSALNLNGVISLTQPTALVWGADGRLYITEVDGDVKVLTIAFGDPTPGDGDNTLNFYVTEAVTIGSVKSIQNHNDTGEEGGVNNARQSTGIDVTPQFDSTGAPLFVQSDGSIGTTVTDTPAVTMYVTSSDSRKGAGSNGGDLGLDTNSGVITKLVQTGPNSWDAIDIVRGLPRSEENHATNGLEIIQELDANGNLISERAIVASGGNANTGAPSNNFAGQEEQPLSAAILEIDLDAIKALPVLNDPDQGDRQYVYDIPTLNDPAQPNGGVNDPFGGNDSFNSAKLLADGIVDIYSPGYRNSYDIEVTEDGRVWTYDNGANNSWGGRPVGEAGDNGPNNVGNNTDVSGITPVDNPQNESYIATNLNNGDGNANDTINVVNWNPSNRDNFHEVTRSDDLAPGTALSTGGNGAVTVYTDPDDGLTYVYGGHPNPTRAEASRAGILFSPKPTDDDAFLLVSDQDSFGNGGGSDYDEVIAWLEIVEGQDNNVSAGDLTKKVLSVTPGVLYDIYKMPDDAAEAVVAGGAAPVGNIELLGQAGLPADIADIVDKANPIEGDYKEAGRTDGALDTGFGSINGLAEYTATVLDDGTTKMSGAILATQLGGGNIIVMGRNEDGSMSSTTDNLGYAIAADRTVIPATGGPLGIATIGDDFAELGLNKAFHGSIWTAVYQQGGGVFIEVFQPDIAEIPQAGAEFVDDNDQDLDGVDKFNDPFEFSAENGYALGVDERIVLDFSKTDVNPLFQGSLEDIGLFGAALDGTTANQDAQTQTENFPIELQRDGLFDIGGNVIPGGNGPILQIKTVQPGTAIGAGNTARDALHTAIRPTSDVKRVAATLAVKNWIPLAGVVETDQATGLMFGDGTQSNFLRVVFGEVNGQPGIEVGYELGDANYTTLAQLAVPGLSDIANVEVDLRLSIDIADGYEVLVSYRLRQEGQTPGAFVNVPLNDGTPGFTLPAGVLQNVLNGTHTISDGDTTLPSGAAIGIIAEDSPGGTPLDSVDFLQLEIESFGNEIDASNAAQVAAAGTPAEDTVIYDGTDTDLTLNAQAENFDGSGSSADFNLTANDLDNEITVGSGNNTITTGDGADRVLGTAASLNNTEITDFSVDDEVVITDATLIGASIEYEAGSAIVSVNGTSITFSGPDFEGFDPLTGDQVFNFENTEDGLSITLTPAETILYRVNAGSGGTTATDGSTGSGTIAAIDGGPDWLGDATLINSTGPVSVTGATTNVYTQALTNAQNEIDAGNVDLAVTPWQLFVNERSDNAIANPKLTYNFDVETGTTYKITLFYTENWNNVFGYSAGTASGTKPAGQSRQFDVSVEGTVPTAFEDLNPFEEAIDILDLPAPPTANTASNAVKQPYLGVALQREFVYTAGDDVLTLEFEHEFENPKINAIQITQLGGTFTPPSDTTAPVIVSLDVANDQGFTDGTRLATVVLSDETGFDVADLAQLEPSFTGIVPAGVSAPAITLSNNGQTATLEYTLQPPAGGSWPAGDVGTISFAAGAFADAAGNGTSAASANFVIEPFLDQLGRGQVVRAINLGTTDQTDGTLAPDPLDGDAVDNNRYGGAIAADSLITDAFGNPVAFEADSNAFHTSPKANGGLNNNVDGALGPTGSNGGGVDLDGSAYHTYRDSNATSWTSTYDGFENGTYIVELHFAELFQPSAGTRVGAFTVNGTVFDDEDAFALDGTPVTTGEDGNDTYDAFAAAGGPDAPTVIRKAVTVTDGTIQVGVTSTAGQAGYSAIVVYDAVAANTQATLSIGDVVVSEGDTATITITRSGDLSGITEVDVALDFDGSAQAADVGAVAPTTVSFAIGETVKQVTLPIIDDTDEEGVETLSVVLSNASGDAVIADATATVTIAASDIAIQAPVGATIFELDFEGPGGEALDVGGFDGTLGDEAFTLDEATSEITGGKLVVQTAEGDINDGTNGNNASINDFTKTVDLSDPALTEIFLTTRFDNPFDQAFFDAQELANTTVPNFAQQGIVLGTGTQLAGEMVKLVWGGVAGNPDVTGVQMWTKGMGQPSQAATLAQMAGAGVGPTDVAFVELTLMIDKATGQSSQYVTLFDDLGNVLGGTRPTATPGFFQMAPLTTPAAVLTNITSTTALTHVGVHSTDNSDADGEPLGVESFEVAWDFLRLSSPQFVEPADDTDGPSAAVTLVLPTDVDGDLVVSVVYSDATGVDASTVTADDIDLQGPEGTVTTSAGAPGFDAQTNTATYTYSAPTGGWTNGDYTATVVASAVSDTATPANPNPGGESASQALALDTTPADSYDLDGAGGNDPVEVGDFSNDRLAPTAIGTLQDGDNVIFATQQGDDAPGGRDRDYFTFVVPEGKALTALFLDGYVTTESTGVGFMGLQEGAAITVDPLDGTLDPGSEGLQSGLLYGNGAQNIGDDLLPLLASGENAPNLGDPWPGLPEGVIPAGTWTLWLNQGGPSTSVTLRAVVGDAPAPAITLSIADAPTLAETGDTGTTDLAFALTATDATLSGPVDVSYDTDTQAGLSQSVTFAEGTATLTVSVPNDDVNTGDTSVTVTLTDASNGGADSFVISDTAGSASGTVTEDDAIDPNDIDGDGIPNTDDPFAYDPSNGDAKVLVAGGEFTQDFNTDTTDPFSPAGGFSGILVNQNFNYPNTSAADPYGDRTNEAKVSISGGALSVTSSNFDAFPVGATQTGASNTLADGYQSAVDVSGVTSFEVVARVNSDDWLSKVNSTTGFEQFGITIGAGGTDDFVKLVISDGGGNNNNPGAPRVQIAHNQSLIVADPSNANEDNYTVGAAGGPAVDLALVGDYEFRLIVDRAAGANGQIVGRIDFFAASDESLLESFTVQTVDILAGSSLEAALDGANPLTGGDGGLAYGIFVSDWSGTNNEFTANYDFLTIRALDQTLITLSGTPSAVEAGDDGTTTTLVFDLQSAGNAAATVELVYSVGGVEQDPVTVTFDATGAATLAVAVANDDLADGDTTVSVALVSTATAGFAVDATASTGTVTEDDFAPVAVADTPSTAQGVAITFDPAANDTDGDLDGGTLTVTAIDAVDTSDYTIALDNGQVTVTPLGGFTGEITFGYTVSDGTNEAQGTATVTVTEPPVSTTTRIEAEDFDSAVEYGSQGQAAASGGQVIALGNNETGSATYDLAARGIVAGTYIVILGLFDENDGESAVTLDITSTDQPAFTETFTLDDDATSGNAAQAASFRQLIFTDVAIGADGSMVISATSNAGEFARIDYVEFISSGTVDPGDNTPPEAPFGLEDQTVDEGAAFSYDAGSLFDDLDGQPQPLSFTAVSGLPGGALPDGLTFADGVLSGTPTVPGEYLITVTASDGLAQASESFTLSVNDVNQSPVLSTPVADATVTTQAAVSLDLSANFSDPDGDQTLSFVLIGDLPDGLSFDGATGVLSGTATETGAFELTIQASDTEFTISDTFFLNVSGAETRETVRIEAEDFFLVPGSNGNQFLLGNAALGPMIRLLLEKTGTATYDLGQLDDVIGEYDIRVAYYDENDGESEASIFAVDGGTETLLGNWVWDNDGGKGGGQAANHKLITFSGLTVLPGTELKLVVTSEGDERGLVDYVELIPTGDNTFNLPPVVADGIDDQSVGLGAVSIELGAAFSDPEEDALTYSVVSGQDWLTVQGSTLTGTPPAAGSYEVVVRATDVDGSGFSADTSFSLIVVDDNAPPVLQTPVGSVTLAEGELLEVAPIFSDPEGQPLTYTLSEDAPGWVSVDPVFGFLSGTPGNADVGEVTFAIIATDVGGLSTTDTVTLIVTDVNANPELGTPLEAQSATVGQSFSYVLPAGAFTDEDPGDVLTYSATLIDGSTLPGWLTIDPATGALSGTPDVAEILPVVVRATDLDGAFVETTVVVTVTSVAVPEDPIVIQAEDFDSLPGNNAVVQAIGSADGDAVARIAPQGGTATISTSLSAVPPVSYIFGVTFLDETDGAGTATLLVDGVEIGNWVFDGQAGTQVNPGAQTGPFGQPGNYRFIEFATPVAITAGSTVTLTMTSDAGEFGRIDSITLTPVDDQGPVNAAPTAVVLTNVLPQIDEGLDTTNPVKVADITVTDADGIGFNVLSLAGDDADLFEIVGNELVLKAGTVLDATGNATLDVTVQVNDPTITDGTAVDASVPLSLTVSGGNALPELTGPTAASVAENTTAVASFAATDADAEDTLTFGLTGDDAGLFTITPDGQLSFSAAPDFETPRDVGEDNIYNVTVTLTDGTATVSQAVSVTVTDVDETGPQDQVLLRINAFGAEVEATDGTGVNWSADLKDDLGTSQNENSPYLSLDSTAAAQDRGDTQGYSGNSALIPASVPQAVLNTARSSNEPFSYTIPVTDLAGNGAYRVNLYFAELFPGNQVVGDRVFDIAVEGVTDGVLDNFDPSSPNGGGDLSVVSYEVTVSDGALNIGFAQEAGPGGADNPIINAIEVIKIGETPVLDTDAPTAAITLVNPADESSPLGINVALTDASGIDESTLGNEDLLVTAGGGTTTATFLSFENGVASYEVAPPFGGWTDGLVVDVTLKAGEVADLAATPNTNAATSEAITIDIGGGNTGDGQVLLRINAFGPEIAGTDGPNWLADTTATPSPFYTSTQNRGDTDTTPAAPGLDGVPNAIFATARSDDAPFSYNIPISALPGVAVGDVVTVNLYFAEASNSPGLQLPAARIFDVQIEGALAIDDFSPVGSFGAGSGGVVSTVVEVVGDTLNIAFLNNNVQNAIVNGVEIIAGGEDPINGGGGPVDPPVTPDDPLEILAGLTDVDNDGIYGPGATGSATLSIMPGVNSVQSSNFGADSFKIENTGDKQIAAVFIDFRTALYGDSVVDFDGFAGDTSTKAFAVNSQTGGNGSGAFFDGGETYYLPGDAPLENTTGTGKSPATGGFRGLLLKFDGSSGGFTDGEVVGFSGDMDPNSIAGLLKGNTNGVDTGAVNSWDVGGISGAELIGSSFTIRFDDGTTATGYLGSDGSQAGSVGEAVQDRSEAVATVTVNGFDSSQAGTYGGTPPVIVVNGPANATVLVTLSKGLNPVTNTSSGVADLVADRLVESQPEFLANNAADFQTFKVTLDGSGTATLPATAFDYNDPDGGQSFNGTAFTPGFETAPIVVAASVVDTDDTPLGPVDRVYLASDGNAVVGGGGNSGVEGYFELIGTGSAAYFKMQIEDSRIANGGQNPDGQWNFVAAPDSAGNQAGFTGDGYYLYGSTASTGINGVNQDEVLEFTIFVPEGETGNYNFQFRVSRDGVAAGDQQNDLWLNFKEADQPGAGDIEAFLTNTANEPEPLSNGYIKLFGGPNNGTWGNPGTIDGEPNNFPAQINIAESGFYTIQVAGRSQGFHIDSFWLAKSGGPTPNANSADSPFVVTDPNAPLAPVISGGPNASVVEGTTVALDVDATDLNNDTLTYAITGGADAALFGIDSSTGVVTFNTVPDFEAPADAGGNNVYNIQVTVSDPGGLFDVQNYAVTVTDDPSDNPPTSGPVLSFAVLDDSLSQIDDLLEAGDSYALAALGGSIEFTGTVSGGPVGSVVLQIEDASGNVVDSAIENLAPYDITWAGVTLGEGSYTLVATSFAGKNGGGTQLGVQSTAFSITGDGGGTSATLTIPIGASADDWEQFGGAGSNDLEFGLNGGPQTVGLRFDGITIPDGATLTDAFIRFTALETQTGAANLIVGIEDTENAAAYTATNAPQSRATIDDFDWNPPAWTAGQIYTLDVADLVAGVIGDDGIDDGALSFIIRPDTNPGSRVAVPFDGNGQEPELVLVFDDVPGV